MNNLAKVRNEVGITQRELAVVLNWNQPRIANYEMGIRTPSLKDAHKLVAAFKQLGADVELNDLFPPAKS